ncbi:MAG: amidohydrolase family protein [Pseudomonadota bacterium]
MKRRDFVRFAATTGVLGPIGGCVKDVPSLCFASELMKPDATLVIDTHTHIFNATDLPVKNFISKVVARDHGFQEIAEVFGGLLEFIGWRAAPTVEKELEKLRMLRSCADSEMTNSLAGMRQAIYSQSVAELRTAAEQELARVGIPRARMRDRTTLSNTGEALRGIYQLPDSYEAYTQAFDEDEPFGIRRKSLTSGIAFIVEMFQYRITSAYNYLAIYNNDATTPVDLIAAALVDYDWWLSAGVGTPSSLPDQVDLMGELAIVTAGRAHMLVPFCPFRQIIANSGSSAARFDPLALVRTAVEEKGALGVKLYPPMGFAPYGNAQLDIWRDKGLPGPASNPQFGAMLDDALRQLYNYCQDKGVAVMAHSSPSNAAHRDYLALMGASFFEQLVTEFPDLNISLGHFGGTGSGDSLSLEHYMAFLAGGSNHRFADASYFANLEDAPETLKSTLLSIYRFQQGALIPRLNYGSDWKMLVAEAQSKRYLSGFRNLIQQIEAETGYNIMTEFLGGNAARMYGLRTGQARQRLNEFYRANQLDSPVWISKVDRN